MKVSKIMSPAVKVHIKSALFFLKRILHWKSKVITPYKIVEYRTPRVHTFFGYYDVSPFNNRNEVLYLELPNDSNSVRIVKNDTANSGRQMVASSNAWNWQQGSRLRWITDDVISFNDFQDGLYLNRFIDIRTKKEDIIPYPLYDIDKACSLGLTLDFERLGRLRPGYGYTCSGKHKPCSEDDPAISIVNIKGKRIVKSITYKDIYDSFQSSSDLEKCYVNHLSFSPKGDKFLFFWIELVRGYHKASLGVYEMESGVIHTLENVDKVSHYVWVDDDTILCTAYRSPNDCRYYSYRISGGSKEPFCIKCLKQDGHPSLYLRNLILTDTYPDASGYQFLRIVDPDTDSFKNILEIFSVPVTSGERRTDLHPRLNSEKDIISFDANVRGLRSMFLLKKA
jgi:hypothetical protein